MNTPWQSGGRDDRPQFSRSGRTRRGRRCPICNKPDWCTVSDDGRFVLCMRIAAGAIKGTRNDGYLHAFDGVRPAPIRIESPTSRPIAPIERRDRINRALLAGLRLEPRHRNDLRRRGLDDAAIEQDLFRSMPDQRRADAIASRLGLEFDGLGGIPGFYFAAGDWRMVTGKWWSGYFVPVMDPAGRIEGFQVRRDDASTGPRYVWFSSAGRPKHKPNGCGAQARPHFVKPERAGETRTILITEGPLKVTIASHFLDVAGVGLTGVLSFGDDFGARLVGLFPTLQKAVLAFDVETKKEVKRTVDRATIRIGTSLRAAGLAVEVWRWKPAEGKGIDDCLLNLARGGRE